VDDIFDAGEAVLAPFSTEGLSIRVTSIEIDKDGKAIERWTQDRGTIEKANLGDIDKTLLEPNSALVRAETVYVYETPFQKVFPAAFTFKHKMDLRPRTGVLIPRN
jgi:hypothetical protein